MSRSPAYDGRTWAVSSRWRGRSWTRCSCPWRDPSCCRSACAALACSSMGPPAPARPCWPRLWPPSVPWPSWGRSTSSPSYQCKECLCIWPVDFFGTIFLFLLSSVKGPELINMYVGQSEENVREGKRRRMLSVVLPSKCQTLYCFSDTCSTACFVPSQCLPKLVQPPPASSSSMSLTR